MAQETDHSRIELSDWCCFWRPIEEDNLKTIIKMRG